MHLYTIPRGIKNEVDMAINDLQAQFLPYIYQGKQVYVQLAVRPLIPYELVFPKEHLQLVLNTIWDTDPVPDNYWIDKMCKGMRLALGAKPLPKLDKKTKLLIRNKNIGWLPIGVKDDGETVLKTEQL